GGIIGARVGDDGLPSDWLTGLIEWPCSVSYMKRLGTQLHDSIATESACRPVNLPVCGLIPRNLLFLIVVLYHGFRRLFPPY
ncbi:MAG: ADP-ribosylglycohydrolase family protein, partial [Planctomycetaceae bacterium]